MTHLIEIIFTSGIISVIISYLMFQKGNQLKYITEERQKWREELRKIAHDLSYADSAEIFGLLTELKVRINTYGYGKDNDDDFSHDAHIWNIIAEIERLKEEELSDDSPKLKKYRNFLIDYISLLLKDDWERSKQEVDGIKKSEFGYILLRIVEIVAISVLAVVFNDLVATYYNDIVIVQIIWGVIVLLLLLLFYIKLIIDIKKWCKDEKQKELGKGKEFKKREENYQNTLKRIIERYKRG